ncbi:hypothetical protein [Streptomyces violascens]|uniref:hypothetical protein n=1 Tax=Streptomyces violascens TaxID=67381 RepID=UPI0036C40387
MHGSQQHFHYPPGEVVTANPGFSVILNATLNGIRIGSFTSENQFAAVTQDHAEDQLIDELTAAIEWARMGHPQMAVQGAGAQVIPALEAGIHQGRTVHSLQIDLSASPCSTAFGTSTKINGAGCAERLVELTQLRFGNEDQYGLAINVRAHHLYQPRHIQDPAQVSTQVNQWMASRGVPVQIG